MNTKHRHGCAWDQSDFHGEGILSMRLPRHEQLASVQETTHLPCRKWIPCILLHSQANERLTAQKRSARNVARGASEVKKNYLPSPHERTHTKVTVARAGRSLRCGDRCHGFFSPCAPKIHAAADGCVAQCDGKVKADSLRGMTTSGRKCSGSGKIGKFQFCTPASRSFVSLLGEKTESPLLRSRRAKPLRMETEGSLPHGCL